jgi:hypothetical protein
MLRPWVPLIALGLLLALAWTWNHQAIVWLGGGILVLAFVMDLLPKLKAKWRRQRAVKKAFELDWKIIDNSMADDRLKRDCERPETLGICTGRDCLVYDDCQFNIKKPLP